MSPKQCVSLILLAEFRFTLHGLRCGPLSAVLMFIAKRISADPRAGLGRLVGYHQLSGVLRASRLDHTVLGCCAHQARSVRGRSLPTLLAVSDDTPCTVLQDSVGFPARPFSHVGAFVLWIALFSVRRWGWCCFAVPPGAIVPTSGSPRRLSISAFQV